MYERRYGALCDKNRPVKDDAALIRRTIRAAVKAGDLPADWAYSVRFRRRTGGSSIDAYATAPRPIYAADPDRYDHPHVRNAETGEWVTAYADRMTGEARRVEHFLSGLLAAYNFDGSETQVDYWDVKFYGMARVSTADGIDQVMSEGRCPSSDECGGHHR